MIAKGRFIAHDRFSRDEEGRRGRPTFQSEPIGNTIALRQRRLALQKTANLDSVTSDEFQMDNRRAFLFRFGRTSSGAQTFWPMTLATTVSY